MLAASTIVVAAAAFIPASSASAATNACVVDSYETTSKVGGVTYQSEGTAVGKRAATSGPLSISITTTQSRATALMGGATVTLDYMIAKVQGTFSVTVTKTTTTGVTVTDQMNVAAGYYGYAQPKAEFQEYKDTKTQNNANCTTTTSILGDVNAIITNPFFSECTATTSCTPKP